MDEQLKAWLKGFNCAACSCDVGSVRRAGVLVLVQDPGHDPEIIAFCYRHAGIYVSRWAEPAELGGIRDALAEVGRAAGALGRMVMGTVAPGLRQRRRRRRSHSQTRAGL